MGLRSLVSRRKPNRFKRVKSSDQQYQEARRLLSEATVQVAADIRLLEQRQAELQALIKEQQAPKKKLS